MKRATKSIWRELKTKKDEFQKILAVLNRYYHKSGDELTQSQLFREKVALANVENLRIFLQKFGKYEFLITVKLLEEEKWLEDSWIHVDGIQEEREQLKRKGCLNHPVFSITCLTDLYKQAEKTEESLIKVC